MLHMPYLQEEKKEGEKNKKRELHFNCIDQSLLSLSITRDLGRSSLPKSSDHRPWFNTVVTLRDYF